MILNYIFIACLVLLALSFLLIMIGFLWPRLSLFWYGGKRTRLNSFLIYSGFGVMVMLSMGVISKIHSSKVAREEVQKKIDTYKSVQKANFKRDSIRKAEENLKKIVEDVVEFKEKQYIEDIRNGKFSPITSITQLEEILLYSPLQYEKFIKEKEFIHDKESDVYYIERIMELPAVVLVKSEKDVTFDTDSEKDYQKIKKSLLAAGYEYQGKILKGEVYFQRKRNYLVHTEIRKESGTWYSIHLIKRKK